MITENRDTGISRDEIQLELPYPVWDILDFKFVHQLNEHSTLEVNAILDIPWPKLAEFMIHDVSENDMVRLRANGDIVFTGKIYHIQSKILNKVGYLKFLAHTTTKDMDFKLESRSFQNKHMLHSDIAEFISDANGGDCVATVEPVTIEKPVYQYLESDWEFLKRVAAEQESFITPDFLSETPRFFFGVPKPKKELSITRTDFHRIECYESQDRKEYFKYNFQYRDFLTLGDAVHLTIQEKSKNVTYRLIIVKMTGLFEKGELKFYYEAENEETLNRKPYTNKKIKGISIRGTVLDVSRDHVKVHLDIDKNQPLEEAFWYPMAYESNQILYAMPHINERIHLCITDEMSSGYGMTDTRGITGRMATTSTMDNPTEKYIQTRWGKTVAFHEQNIEFDTQVINMKLEEDSITIFANDKITIETEEDINIGTTKGLVPDYNGQMIEVFEKSKNIKINTEELITLKNKYHQTAVEITSYVEWFSKFGRIKYEGKNKAPMPLLSSPGQEYDPNYKPPGYRLTRNADNHQTEIIEEEEPQEERRRGGWLGRAARAVATGLAVAAAVVVLVKLAPIVVSGAVAIKAGTTAIKAGNVARGLLTGARGVLQISLSGLVPAITSYTALNAVNEISQLDTAEEVIDYLGRSVSQIARQRYMGDYQTSLGHLFTMSLSIISPTTLIFTSGSNLVYNIDNWEEGVEQNGWWHAVETGLFALSTGIGTYSGIRDVQRLNRWFNSKIFLRRPATRNGTLNIGAGSNPTRGAYNIDLTPRVPGVRVGNATDLSNIRTGSQSLIIIDNPYKFDPLNSEILRVLQPGGIIEVTGSNSNPFFNKILKKLAGTGLRLVRTETVTNIGQFTDSDGIVIPVDRTEEFIRRILELIQ